MTEPKYIFLDIDGVLNCDTTREYTPGGFTGIDRHMVQHLAKIVQTSGAEIILSSSWKYCWKDGEPDDDAQYLLDHLASCSLTVSGFTPSENAHGSFHRGGEILEYLKEHPYFSFVILDDEEFDYTEAGMMPHLVHTDYTRGLAEQDIPMALRILENELADQTAGSESGHRKKRFGFHFGRGLR